MLIRHLSHNPSNVIRQQTHVNPKLTHCISFLSFGAAVVKHPHLCLVTEVKDMLSISSFGDPITFAVN